MSALGSSEVQFVSFGLLGENDHARRSFVTVKNYELYAGTQPVPEGAYDLRMGTVDHHYNCVTCAHGKKRCDGHPGAIRLLVPLISPIAMGHVRKAARIFCIGDSKRPGCGAPVVDLARLAALPEARRFNAAAQMTTEGRKCRECGAIHPKIVKDKEDYITFWAEEDGGARRWKLHPHVLKAAFSRVAASVAEALGLPPDAHPANLLLSVVQMPPNSIRPGVKSFGAGQSANSLDITNLLQHIVKRNSRLPSPMPAAVDAELDVSIYNMQELYYNLILGSNSTSITQGNSGKRGIVVGTRSAPSILRRLPRKKGLIRDSLLGKRVFIIGRNTISGNTMLRIDQVGVPVAFARTLQVAERVTEINKERLGLFFLNRRRQYPGCSRVVKGATGDVHDVEGLRGDFALEVGDLLFRDLVGGDKVFFNRQPTLERSSIGVHEAVVLEDPSIQTLQMNVIACGFYNADFNFGVQKVATCRDEAFPGRTNSVNASRRQQRRM